MNADHRNIAENVEAASLQAACTPCRFVYLTSSGVTMATMLRHRQVEPTQYQRPSPPPVDDLAFLPVLEILVLAQTKQGFTYLHLWEADSG